MSRPSPRRSSLAGASPVRPPEPVAAPASAPPAAEPKATAPTKKSAPNATRPAVKARSASDTARLGIYLTPQAFTDAKAAYLAAWQLGGEAATFAHWIAGTIDAHARRSPAQRANLSQPKGRADTRTGASRSFTIPTDTIARMREAITADQRADRWVSDSAWCGEAIAAAVEETRTANAGVLPTPPPRLPNRLTR